MIPLFKVRTSPTIGEDVEKTLLSGMITQGPKVDELERAIDKELNMYGYPTAVNSATSGLDLALDLIGVGPGDEVISTPMTCYATNVNIAKRGAKIVWADVFPTTGNINYYDIDKKITKKTKAIMAVNWSGQFADYGPMMFFNIPIIEDAAHTWDTYENDEFDRGDFVVYSLQAIKFLTAGDGGLLYTPNEIDRKLARMKRWYGLDRDNNQSFRSMQDIDVMGYKYNMNDVSATIALSNMRFARNSVEAHRKNARLLHEGLSDLKYAAPVPFRESSSYWFFPLILNLGVDRSEFEKYMLQNGIQAQQVHTRNDNYSILKDFKIDGLHGLDFFSEHQINIPCGWWLTESDVQYIIETIRNYGKS
jgi:dTDP-4-amino-4,6-dideoxygalactose transaminase